jgi:hypothetical protein
LAQVLLLPDRPANAPSGARFAEQTAALSVTEREQQACDQLLAGNVPQFLRYLCQVQVTNVIAGRTNTASFFVTPDYLAIGSDADYLLLPLTPQTAQRLADGLGCSLPTPKMVDAIYSAATVKLAPSPIPPSAEMTSIVVFSNHNAIIRAQRVEQLPAYPLGALVAGHKKDVVISARLTTAPGKVAIYGWHRTNGAPIQPLYLGHTAGWVDYSQCTRLVQQKLFVNGQAKTVAEVLADPVLAGLLSDEGPIPNPCYSTNAQPLSSVAAPSSATKLPGGPAPLTLASLSFLTNAFQERITSFTLENEVMLSINAPAAECFTPEKKVWLVFYALPNGNTTAQTIGKTIQPSDDRHFDIQHIGAQTRFLRDRIHDRVIVVVYLENALRSWPAWRRKFGDQQIPEILATVKNLFAAYTVEVVLDGHSGGGSLLFGYFNTVDKIPDDIVRLAFLDSNYAYGRPQGHLDKIAAWLKASDNHFLCVLAYNDAVALLDGKPFVSAEGGTWGRSHAMQRDLAEFFPFTTRTNADFQRFSALGGRVQFVLKENPERKIFHTVQVERNGFIHSLLSGTPYENDGYEYFGPRAYEQWIEQSISDQARYSSFRSLTDFSEFNRTKTNGQVVLLSPKIESTAAWDQLVLSWNATAAPGTFLIVEARAIQPHHTTKFYSWGRWSPDDKFPPRGSEPGQKDADGDVLTDTLSLNSHAQAVQLRITLGGTNDELPMLKFLGISFSNTKIALSPVAPNRAGWGKDIPTPERSQQSYAGGNGWCSPTSLSMALARWSAASYRADWDLDAPEVALGVADHNFKFRTGNWSFNVAFAGSLNGMRAYATRFSDISELEDWIAAGIPVIISARWDLLQDGRPPDYNGHLTVCRGVTENGDLIINDPWTDTTVESVRHVYKRENVRRAWSTTHNTVYLVYPEGTRIPEDRFGHWER